jgi:hypothetical protein
MEMVKIVRGQPGGQKVGPLIVLQMPEDVFPNVFPQTIPFLKEATIEPLGKVWGLLPNGTLSRPRRKVSSDTTTRKAEGLKQIKPPVIHDQVMVNRPWTYLVVSEQAPRSRRVRPVRAHKLLQTLILKHLVGQRSTTCLEVPPTPRELFIRLPKIAEIPVA